MNEFELIRAYFASQPVARADVVVGIGDDAAVLAPPAGRRLAVTTDVLVEGTHFLPGADPEALGHKALAVNLSDLAAMGAEPAWFTLNLTLPRADEGWLKKFCAGLYALARRYNVQLVGGNTARGPLAIAIEAHGFVPEGETLRRSGARAGDRLYVTGTLGDAALALKQRLGTLRLPERDLEALAKRLDCPEPRVREGLLLRGVASSAIDISDGLLADLGHLLEASGMGAQLRLEQLPLSPAYRAHLDKAGWEPALGGGEDYELCFTVSPERAQAFARLNLPAGAAPIGDITAEPGLRIFDAQGAPYPARSAGHNHFADRRDKP